MESPFANNMKTWNAVKQPPKSALREIQAGRLKGKSDINPQWRLEALTSLFGPCGVGWGYTIDRLWTEQGAGVEVMAFALVTLWYAEGDTGATGKVPGIGGSMLTAQESKGPYNSDEAFKMAVTDALSVACKALGFGADVYHGRWDGTKYRDGDAAVKTPVDPVSLSAANAAEKEVYDLMKQAEDLGELGALVKSTEFADKMTALKALSVDNYERCRIEIKRRLGK